MRYISLFSGLGTTELAFQSLGWECVAVAEIEKFPCAVLAHRFPNIPNLGDVSRITEQQIKDLGEINLVVFGSPCQDLSIAGKRAGLKGERSGLFFDAMRIVRWSRARWALWENVPGAFSSNEGNDFAAVVGEMAGLYPDVPKGGWENSGFYLGPEGLVEWSVLDAQFFGVPQRRRRIFAIRDIGSWRDRPPVLLESHSLSGNPAPSRKTWERVAGTVKGGSGERGYPDPSDGNGGGLVEVCGTLNARTKGGGGLGTDFELGGGIVPLGGTFDEAISPALSASGRGTSRAGDSRGQDALVAFGGSNTSGPIDIATACNAKGGAGRMDFETETFVTAPLTQNPYEDNESRESLLIAHSLRGGGFEASEYGTGRGTPLVPVCFTAKDHGADASETAPTLRAGGHSPSHANAGVMPAIAFNLRGREEGSMPEVDDVASIRSVSGGSSRSCIAQMEVRRLTPLECERLQGLPDNWTQIPRPLTGLPAADGPRYKSIGNGMAFPVVRWIGERIEAVEAIG